MMFISVDAVSLVIIEVVKDWAVIRGTFSRALRRKNNERITQAGEIVNSLAMFIDFSLGNGKNISCCTFG